ncbi:MAG: lipid-A-disaccharide synthase [Pseudomonadota bacterium]
MSDARRFFLIAGEPSGDRLGAALMRGLRAESDVECQFEGVGGSAMAAEGLESLFDIRDIAVMGFAEVVPKLATIRRRLRQTTDAVLKSAPDALITIDAPGFGLRVAKATRARSDACFVHYVAPSVWAWRPKRAEMMAEHTDHLLALLPFEPPYFEAVGLSCDSVGHPVVEATAQIDPGDIGLRAELGVAADAPLIAALPGSRRGEVARLGEVFGAALQQVSQRVPRLQVLVPAAENVVDQVKAMAATWPLPAYIVDPRGLPFAEAERRKFRAMAAADAALAASGTVSLELAAMRTPMVIGYRTSWLTAQMVKRLINIDTATLVNLLVKRKVVPEFFQEACTPEALAEALTRVLVEGSAELRAQLSAADEALQMLGRGGTAPSIRAARSVLEAMEKHKVHGPASRRRAQPVTGRS